MYGETVYKRCFGSAYIIVRMQGPSQARLGSRFRVMDPECSYFDECNATDLLSKMFTDFTGNIRGFSIRTGTLLIIIIILYIVTLLPQDFLTNENENKRSLKEKQTETVRIIKYNYTFLKQTFLGRPRVRGRPSGSAAATLAALSRSTLTESCLEPI